MFFERSKNYLCHASFENNQKTFKFTKELHQMPL
jgi:hypothetical protein